MDVRDLYPSLESKTTTDLLLRREEIIKTAPEGDMRSLSDEALAELVAINRTLRRKNAGPPKPATKRGSPKTEATLDDLA